MPKQPKPQGDPLAEALAGISKDFGPGTVVELGSQQHLDVSAVSTGSIGLDFALGVGGIPLGRVTELFGPEGSGKSTLALALAAEAQKAGGVCAYVDAEHAVDPDYAKALGVDTGHLLFSQPDNGEQGLEVVERLAKTGAVKVVVVDSVAALVPRAEIEGEMGDAHMGLQARLMSQALRKITATQSIGTAVVFINQLREKIGIIFGSPETTPGGKALKFYSSVRLDIRRIETLKDGALPIGNRVRVKAVKNKVGPPLRSAEFNIIFGRGIDWADELLELGVSHAVIARSGSHYTVGPVVLGNGRAAACAALRGKPEQAQAVRQAVLADLAEGRTGPLLVAMHPDRPPTRVTPDGQPVPGPVTGLKT